MTGLAGRAQVASQDRLGRPFKSIWAATTAYGGLFKFRVVSLLVVVSLVTAVVAAGGVPPAQRLLLLALAGALAASGAAAVNHYLDRDLDTLMGRTQSRPLPSRRIARSRTVLEVGLGLLVAGVVVSLALGTLTTFFVVLGAAIYILVYTLWLKRRHPLNIVIGGAAGSCAALAGWAAVGGSQPLVAGLLASLVFFWTPSHFWSFALVHRQDYQRACLPMLPVTTSPVRAVGLILGHNALVLALSVALAYPLGAFGLIYLLGATAGAVLLLWASVRLARQLGPEAAHFHFKASGAYLGLLFGAMLADVLV